MPLIDHIVCPVDMSPSTGPLLAFAATWARWYDADLHMLHAVPPPEMLGDPMGGMIVTTIHRPLQDVRADLERIVTDVVPEDVRSSVEVVEGHPVEAILHDAHARPRSMVIMGSHGRSGLDRIIHGSITASFERSRPFGISESQWASAGSHSTTSAAASAHCPQASARSRPKPSDLHPGGTTRGPASSRTRRRRRARRPPP